jgi:CheY-like chemotaxis protein
MLSVQVSGFPPQADQGKERQSVHTAVKITFIIYREASNLCRRGYNGTDLAIKVVFEDPRYSREKSSGSWKRRRGTMSEKILVVDDEKEIRDLLSIYLQEDGYEVIAASDGQEAISMARAELPQVILMDVKMPGIDGVETCKRLKEEEKTKSIPIIMVTAYQDRDVEAYLEGADDFVNKPFDRTEITFRVRSMMRIRHLNDELERAMAYIEELDKNLPKR